MARVRTPTRNAAPHTPPARATTGCTHHARHNRLASTTRRADPNHTDSYHHTTPLSQAWERGRG